jgi:hypothetical protein
MLFEQLEADAARRHRNGTCRACGDGVEEPGDRYCAACYHMLGDQ